MRLFLVEVVMAADSANFSLIVAFRVKNRHLASVLEISHLDVMRGHLVVLLLGEEDQSLGG
jgi:hypothetical protein